MNVSPDWKLSANLTVATFTHSNKAIANGIDNSMPDAYLEFATDWATNIYEPLLPLLGVSVHIDSGYRDPKLNQLVKGVSTSQHCNGQAGDCVPAMNILKAFKVIVSSGLAWDQCIFEGSWIHLSYLAGKNRHEILKHNADGSYTHLTKDQALALEN